MFWLYLMKLIFSIKHNLFSETFIYTHYWRHTRGSSEHICRTSLAMAPSSYVLSARLNRTVDSYFSGTQASADPVNTAKIMSCQQKYLFMFVLK